MELALQVIDLYEAGKLKKLSKKDMMAKPDFKQHHFQYLHNLKASFQRDLLEEVIREALPLNILKEKADKFRALEISKHFPNAPIYHGKRV